MAALWQPLVSLERNGLVFGELLKDFGAITAEIEGLNAHKPSGYMATLVAGCKRVVCIFITVGVRAYGFSLCKELDFR